MMIIAAQVTAVYGGQEVTKKYEELYPLTGTASVQIENRYGSIDIRNWEREEVSVEVVITVTHSNRETAERQLSNINVIFSHQNNTIKAVTEIDQRAGRLGSRLFSSGDEGQSIKIDYLVYAPKESDLNITNRYGDIFINEATGHTLLDLRYGNLQANRIIRDNTRPLSEINLAYSTKATVSNADWLKINMRYSDLVVEQCRALVVSSSYSKLKVDNASSIVAESRYGEFSMGNISNLVAEGAYTHFLVNRISNTLDIESRYGNVRVDNMPANFSKLSFVGSYANLRVGIDPDASYIIESTANYGNVNIPSEGRVNRIVRSTQSTLSGIVGNEEAPSSTVDISTRYGNVDLTGR